MVNLGGAFAAFTNKRRAFYTHIYQYLCEWVDLGEICWCWSVKLTYIDRVWERCIMIHEKTNKSRAPETSTKRTIEDNTVIYQKFPTCSIEMSSIDWNILKSPILKVRFNIPNMGHSPTPVYPSAMVLLQAATATGPVKVLAAAISHSVASVKGNACIWWFRSWHIPLETCHGHV